MKNLLFHLKAVKTGTIKAQVGAGAGSRNFLKVGAGAGPGAEKNSLGSATLFESLRDPNIHKIRVRTKNHFGAIKLQFLV
jgi:hypothetical protein